MPSSELKRNSNIPMLQARHEMSETQSSNIQTSNNIQTNTVSVDDLWTATVENGFFVYDDRY